MKHLILSVAGLGWRDIEMRHLTRLCGLALKPAESLFPAVTCTVQAGFRTASTADRHGMVCNGVFSRELQRPSFWEQSANLVRGPRIWERARKKGKSVALLFWQQSLGEDADYLVSPAPIHKHGGGMIMENYTSPPEAAPLLKRECGPFPLHRYWGPLASPSVGDRVTRNIEVLCRNYSPDIVFAYLPTLDYDLQRFGPNDSRCEKSFRILERQLERLAGLAQEMGADLTLFGDYAITEVTRPVSQPNILLRKAGLFKTRSIRGMAYPDFYTSRAFAMADHALAHLYLRDPAEREEVAGLFEKAGYEVLRREETSEWNHPTAGDLLLLAPRGSWCDYRWWSDPREAPDFAGHVDIHSKPGYDPCELFFAPSLLPKVSQDPGRVKGTHGRKCTVAYASSLNVSSQLELAGALKEIL